MSEETKARWLVTYFARWSYKNSTGVGDQRRTIGGSARTGVYQDVIEEHPALWLLDMQEIHGEWVTQGTGGQEVMGEFAIINALPMSKSLAEQVEDKLFDSGLFLADFGY